MNIACVLLQQLPLQMVLRKQPHWRNSPVAIIDGEGPHAHVSYCNQLAVRAGIRIGMQQSAARNLVPTLHTRMVLSEEIDQAIHDLTRSLQTFSPRVEIDPHFPGAFIIDPRGLEKLYEGTTNWATSVHKYLKGRRWQNSIVVGFHRYRCLAIAQSTFGVAVIPTEEKEHARAAKTPLSRLRLPGKLCEQLLMLGVDTLDDFLTLPASELHSRYGEQASALHALFSPEQQTLLQSHAFDEPVRVSFEINPPDNDHARLLFAIKGGLHSLINQTSARAETLAGLKITLKLERTPAHSELIKPAEPTHDLSTLLELTRLRLTNLALTSNIEEVELIAITERHCFEQEQFNQDRPQRNFAAGNRALARIRAAYGPHAVTRASLRPAHLPEASFEWKPASKLSPFTGEVVSTPARPERTESGPRLIRRVYSRPKPLPTRQNKNHEPELCLGRDQTVEQLVGPYRISGGWWKRAVERDYYYARTGKGDLLWLFFDRPRSRWFLHGVLD